MLLPEDEHFVPKKDTRRKKGRRVAADHFLLRGREVDEYGFYWDNWSHCYRWYPDQTVRYEAPVHDKAHLSGWKRMIARWQHYSLAQERRVEGYWYPKYERMKWRDRRRSRLEEYDDED